jgi:hypothetical protein
MDKLTTKEAAVLLGIAPESVARAAKSGRLRGTQEKIEASRKPAWVFDPQDVIDYANESATRGRRRGRKTGGIS